MNWFSRFRLRDLTRKPLSLRRALQTRPLGLERLEERDVPAAPTVLSVTPAPGGVVQTPPKNNTPPPIQVVFSEDVTGANVASNFKLFGADGIPVTINNITYNSVTHTTTIDVGSLTLSGGFLTAGTYSLYLQADKIIDVDENLPISGAGEIVVANRNGPGGGALATASQINNGLGAVQQVDLIPTTNPFFDALATASGDVNNDGLNDLLVASTAQDVIEVFLGQPNGGFSLTADDRIALAPSGFANTASMIVVDLSGDNKLDIALVQDNVNAVSVFINANTTPGELAFGSESTYTPGITGPVDLAVGNFDSDAFPDLVAISGSISGGNYLLGALQGVGDGTFVNAGTTTVGTAAVGIQTPTSVAIGSFDGDAFDDVVVGGTGGVSILLNDALATLSFTATTVAGPDITSVATGLVRNNASAQRQDVVATTSTGVGNLVPFLNSGTGTFVAGGLVPAGVADPTNLKLADLNKTFPNRTGTITTTNASGVGAITVTSPNHGLPDGTSVTISGVVGHPQAIGTFTIQNVTTNTYELVGTTGSPAATGTGGTWTAPANQILDVTGLGVPIVITSPNHGLLIGQTVVITGVVGNNAANGTFTISAVTTNTFTLINTDGTPTNGTGTYVSGGQFRVIKQNLIYVNSSNFTGQGLLTRAPMQAGLISAVSATGPFTITSANHGLQNGQRVVIAGVGAAANGTFTVAGVTTNTFSLQGSTGAVTYAGGGTWAAVYNNVAAIGGSAGNPYIITSHNHGLRTEQQVSFTGIAGTGGLPAALNNRTFFITRIDANTFSLNGTVRPAGQTYTANSGTLVIAPYATAIGPQKLTLVDFTNDGIDDVVTVNSDFFSLNSRSEYVGSGSNGVADGTFLSASRLSLAGAAAAPTSVAVADMNADNLADLVTTDFQNNTVNVFLALAAGGYAAPVAFSTLQGGSSRDLISVAVGDVNSDGRPDVIAASNRDNNVSVFLNTTSSTGFSLGTPTRISTGATPWEVILADINTDGAKDILVAHNSLAGGAGSRGVTILLGNNNGTFQVGNEVGGPTSTTNGTFALALAVADFNRDGRPDLAVVNDRPIGSTDPHVVRVFNGNGFGGFSAPTDYAVTDHPTDIAVGDFNADGFDDIATISRTNTTDNLSVLINNQGSGFQAVVNTTVDTGATLDTGTAQTSPYGSGPKLTVGNLNNDAFPDLLVGNGIGRPTTNTQGLPNNVLLLFSSGDGLFTLKAGYALGGVQLNPQTGFLEPTATAFVRDPFLLLSRFEVDTTFVATNLVKNGDFERRALTDEQGNLDGWTTFKLKDPTGGSRGQWLPQTGTVSPLSAATVPVPNGRFSAMLDQSNLIPFADGNTNFNLPSSYAGSHALYQDITIPAGISSALLSFNLYLDSTDAGGNPVPFTNITNNPPLDYRTAQPNQQVRVDIMSSTSTPLDVGAGVRRNLFKTTPTTLSLNSNAILRFGSSTLAAFDLSQFAGQTIRLRFAATNNQGKLIVGVDNVRLRVVTNDTTVPSLKDLHLRNPTFLAGPGTIEQSTDPTIVGQVDDNVSINNIKRLIIDPRNDGFGNSDDVIVTKFDVNGFFSFTDTANAFLPGFNTVGIRVIDVANNRSDATYRFIIQGPSLTNWQAVGPTGIDVTAANMDFTTISGKITGIVADPRDQSGNTLYVGSANGGVWKTTDGGKNWLATTDNVLDANGVRVNTPIGHVAVSELQANGSVSIYAATGVDDNSFTSRSSIGILKSTDDGRTWRVLGLDTTTNINVFAGARISKIAVARKNLASDPDTVYVSVTSWDDTTKDPAVFKSTNGGQTWTNVLNPANLFRLGVPLGAATATGLIASVTDLIVDPFNPNRVIIGLGNTGQLSARASAGVYKSIDGGQTWQKSIGGDKAPQVANTFLPEGVTVGRVTLAQGNGRVGDERFVYVLMANPPATVTDSFRQGTYLGLFKTKDNLLNYTRIMLKEPGTNTGNGFFHGQYNETYIDIALLGREGANVGALVVDPSNPNVVYVGGSNRFENPPSPNTPPPQHSLIRVDTGNMRDTDFFDFRRGNFPNDGDDIDKADLAETAIPNVKNADRYFRNPNATGAAPGDRPYTGEGVFWFDLVQGDVGVDPFTGVVLLDNSGNVLPLRTRMPASIQRLAFDSQGRLLVGTTQGLYRAQLQGFKDDFLSSFDGILSPLNGGGPGPAAFPEPVARVSVTELNGNLQIADLTAVAVDPSNPNRFYTTGSDMGGALTPGGTLNWVTNGLVGPNIDLGGFFTNRGSPTGFNIRTAPTAPDALPGAPASLYRTWAHDGVAINTNTTVTPELSADAGNTFAATAGLGIDAGEAAGRSPVLAINPTKVTTIDSGGRVVYFDEILFGSDDVYLSQTSGAVYDKLQTTSAFGDFISAVSFTITRGRYLAGTESGQVFMTINNAFTDVTSGANATNSLASLVTGAYRINGITADPTNPNVFYVMVGGINNTGLSTRLNGIGVFKGTYDPGTLKVTWAGFAGVGTNAATLLPRGSAYAMVIDPRVLSGAPTGKIYVGTETGVHVSADNGNQWTPLGRGLPTTPAVDLQFSPAQEQLTVALQGRGVFVISTAQSGPRILNFTPANPIPAPLTDVTVTFNTAVDPRTFTTNTLAATAGAANEAARALAALPLLNTNEYRTIRLGQLIGQYLRRGTTTNDVNTYLPQWTGGNGELTITSQLVASLEYYQNPTFGGNSNNSVWIERVWRDLLGRTAQGDSEATRLRLLLDAGTMTRVQIADQLTGANSGALNRVSIEFDTNLVASLLNMYLGRNYTLPALTNGKVPTELAPYVTALQNRTPLTTVVSRILGTTEAYQKAFGDIGLPVGVKTTSLEYGHFTGAVTTDGFNNPILDLAVATSGNQVRIYRGRIGGGHAASASAILTLPTGTVASDLVVADFNGDGLPDLGVSHAGLSGADSVSVFLNTRTATSQLSFGSRIPLDGGNQPVSIKAADVDGDGRTDLVVANGALSALSEYTLTVLLGNGDGTFDPGVEIVVGDPVVLGVGGLAKLISPNDVVLANVSGDALPDFIVAGDNGLIVVTNTSVIGSPSGTPLATRLTNLPTTSVAVGSLFTAGINDIVAAADSGSGELLIFRNQGSDVFSLSTASAGAKPRDLHLADMNGDGKLDAVVTNNDVNGRLAILFNVTDPTNLNVFGTPLSYPLTGGLPNVLAVKDANQDGVADVAIGYENSEFFSQIFGQSQGILRLGTDRNWLDALYRSLAGRTYSPTELTAAENTIAANATVSLIGPDGASAPLSITPDASNLTYTLTFAPKLLDGAYALRIGPNATGINIKDFIDLDGSYINTGNAMNQNQNTVNGENPTDQFRTNIAVNSSDTGRFVTEGFEDLRGLSPSGRLPDHNGFISEVNLVEPSRLTSLRLVAANFIGSKDFVDLLVTSVYLKHTGAGPTTTQLNTATAQIMAGTITVRDLVVQLVGNSNAVFSDAALMKTVSEYFLQFLGRIPSATEAAPFVALLKQPAVTNRFSPDQQLINALVSTPEFLRLAGDTNADWLEKIYLAVAGRSSIDTSGSTGREYNGVLTALLSNYNGARQVAIGVLVNDLEARRRFYTDYYTKYLSSVSTVRVPNATELAAQEAFYQANNKRLEAVLANLLRDPEYFPLSSPGSANDQYLSKLYRDLLNRTTAGDANAAAFLNTLNTTPAALLSDARYTVALSILNSTEYRQILIAGFYNTYLGRSKPFQPGNTDPEVNTFVNLMGTPTNATQETVLTQMLGSVEYALLQENLLPRTTNATTTTQYSLVSGVGGVQITATVTGTGGTPTGTVTFVIDGVGYKPVTLQGSTGSITVPLSGGTHRVEAIYSGDASFAASVAAPQNVTVTAPATTTTISNPGTLQAGQAATFTVTVGLQPPASGIVNGDVLLSIDGATAQQASLQNGVVVFTVPSGFSAGTHSATATFLPNGNFSGSSASVVFNVTAAPPPPPPPPPPFNGSREIIAVGAGASGTNSGVTAIKAYDALTGAERFSLIAYVGYRGGVRVAAGDVTGDGFEDLLTATTAGPGGGHIKVFDGRTSAEVRSFLSFPGLSTGFFVTAGDVNGDGRADIIVSTDAGLMGGAIRVYDGADPRVLLREISNIYAGYNGGVRVAAGDIDGDGLADIVTGSGFGVSPHVKVYSGATSGVIRSFLAYDPRFLGGTYLSVGQFNGDGIADIVVTASSIPHIKVFDGRTGATISSFIASDRALPNVSGGSVAAVDRTGDGIAEVVLALNGSPSSQLRSLNPGTFGGLPGTLIGAPIFVFPGFRGELFLT